jgi:hypothetical protein
MFNNFFFSKVVTFMRKVEKYCTTGKATNDEIAHELCILDNYGYRNTDRIYLLLFHSNSGYANAPQYYIISTLRIMLPSLMITLTAQIKSRYTKIKFLPHRKYTECIMHNLTFVRAESSTDLSSVTCRVNDDGHARMVNSVTQHDLWDIASLRFYWTQFSKVWVYKK